MTLATLDSPQVYSRPADRSSTIAVTDSCFFNQSAAGWDRVIRELRPLAILEDDWDGLNAFVPSQDVVETAVDLAIWLRGNEFEIPGRASATPSGTILFEWRAGEDYLEIEVVSPTRLEWMKMDRDQSATHGYFASSKLR